jgi:hypothetical protein
VSVSIAVAAAVDGGARAAGHTLLLPKRKHRTRMPSAAVRPQQPSELYGRERGFVTDRQMTCLSA